jgi:hypothetical protein
MLKPQKKPLIKSITMPFITINQGFRRFPSSGIDRRVVTVPDRRRQRAWGLKGRKVATGTGDESVKTWRSRDFLGVFRSFFR